MKNYMTFIREIKLIQFNSVICSVGFEINDGKQEFYYCNDCKAYFCEKDKIARICRRIFIVRIKRTN